MGNIQLTCDFCGEDATETNDSILKIFSTGKHGGKYICFSCLKDKIEKILIVEGKVVQIQEYTKY